MKTLKFGKYLTAALVLILAVAACGGDDEPAATTAPATTATPTTAAAPAAPATVALVVNQPAGDRGPVDDMVRGLERVEEELGAETTFIEALDPSTFETTLRNLGNQGTDVVAVTFPPMGEALAAVAPDFPDTRWIHVFGSALDMPNVVTIELENHKAMYLAGILAGALNTTGKIGYVGGVSIPSLNADYNAFVMAAQSQNPDITAEAAFIGTFGDPAKARELAAALYDDGADIIMMAGAGGDAGIIQAAEEKGAWAMGGSEEYFSSDAVLVSATIYWANYVFDQTQHALGDEYAPGHVIEGVASGGIDIVVSPTVLENGPAEVVEKINAALPLIEETRSQVRNGELDIPFIPDL